MNTVAVIRDRFQLTIPEEIRNKLSWLIPGTAAEVSLEDNKIVLAPYQAGGFNWAKFWKFLEGVYDLGEKANLSEFVINDRERRR